MKNEIPRKVLVEAVKLIKQWHDFPLPVETAPEEMFRIYYEKAPEMKSIREVLGSYDELNNDSVSKIEALPAPNTVMWWLCRIADPEIRRKAVGYWDGSKTSHTEFKGALFNAFRWAENKDRRMWADIFSDGIPLLPAPEWKEYLELRKHPHSENK